ncbi:hypothetical protein HNY73_020293 [Argiope bruennichi]|uniref:Uncharacterized protein n=1 Tax=Argiope bruennichi TaxID=94029 RepID=A0A8T0E695_ARGBR|nr:hypothetical protein HNY73_020293 [Argiope bruennichi]
MFITYSSAAEQSLFHSEDNIVAYVRKWSELAYKFGAKRNFSEKHQENEPGRFIRAAPNSNSSGRLIKNNSPGAYYFDYLVKEPNGDLQFHIQRRFENGTVVGVYAVGVDWERYITVMYIADANGYRAEVSKNEASLGEHVGIRAERKNGRVEFSVWSIKSMAGVAHNLFTSGKDSKKDDDEEDDTYEE